jgi:hypothetical protein
MGYNLPSSEAFLDNALIDHYPLPIKEGLFPFLISFWYPFNIRASKERDRGR